MLWLTLHQNPQPVTNTPHKATTLPVASKDSLLRVDVGTEKLVGSEGRVGGLGAMVGDRSARLQPTAPKNILFSKCKLRRNTGFYVELLQHGINMQCK